MRLMLLLLAAAILPGCTTTPAITDGLNTELRRARILAHPAWTLRGRISVATPGEGYQGRFNWWQSGESLRLLIRGPLGVGGLEVSGSPASLTVRSGRDTEQLDDPEAQLSALLGWWLPVTSARYWLLGTADERFPASLTSVAGEPTSALAQREWTVRYDQYQLVEGVALPVRIQLSHRELSINLTVDQWTLDPDSGASP